MNRIRVHGVVCNEEYICALEARLAIHSKGRQWAALGGGGSSTELSRSDARWHWAARFLVANPKKDFSPVNCELTKLTKPGFVSFVSSQLLHSLDLDLHECPALRRSAGDAQVLSG